MSLTVDDISAPFKTFPGSVTSEDAVLNLAIVENTVAEIFINVSSSGSRIINEAKTTIEATMNNLKNNVGDFLSIVTAIITKAGSFLARSLSVILYGLNTLLSGVLTQVANGIDRMTAALGKIFILMTKYIPILHDNLASALKDLKQTIVNAGKSAASCIRHVDKAVSNEINLLDQTLTSCIDALSKSLSAIIAALIKSVSTITSQIVNANAKLSSCPLDLISLLFCLSVVLLSTTISVLSGVPTILSIVLVNVLAALIEAESNIETCLTDAVKNTISGIQGIENGLIKCITENISNL